MTSARSAPATVGGELIGDRAKSGKSLPPQTARVGTAMAARSTGSSRSSASTPCWSSKAVARHLRDEVGARRVAHPHAQAERHRALDVAGLQQRLLLSQKAMISGDHSSSSDQRGGQQREAPTRSGASVATCSATQPPNEAPTRIARLMRRSSSMRTRSSASE